MKNQVVKTLVIVFIGLLGVSFRAGAVSFESFRIDAVYDDSKGHIDGYAHERIRGQCGHTICGDGKPHFDGNVVKRTFSSAVYEESRDIRLAKLSDGSSTVVFENDDTGERHNATFIIGGAFTKSKLQSIWDARGRGNYYEYERRKASIFESRNGEDGINWWGYTADAWVGPEGLVDSIQKIGNFVNQGYKFLEVGLAYSLKLDDVSQWSPGHYRAKLQGVDLQQTIWWEGGQSSGVDFQLEVIKKLDIVADKQTIHFDLVPGLIAKPQEVEFSLLSQHKKIELALECSGPNGACAIRHSDKPVWLPLNVKFEVSHGRYRTLKPRNRAVPISFPSGKRSVLSSLIEIGDKTLDSAAPPSGNYDGQIKFVFNATV